MLRQGKSKARQVNSIKDGFKSAEKKGATIDAIVVQRNQTQMMTKSIQNEVKNNLPKP